MEIGDMVALVSVQGDDIVTEYIRHHFIGKSYKLIHISRTRVYATNTIDDTIGNYCILEANFICDKQYTKLILNGAEIKKEGR